jgi:hypothetical protein
MTPTATGSPAGAIEVTDAKFDPATSVEFNISGKGTTAQSDDSQLVSHGAVEFESAKLEVVTHSATEGEPCPVLVPGQTYTFVSTTGTLTGSFANAAEGGEEIPITFEACTPTVSQRMWDRLPRERRGPDRHGNRGRSGVQEETGRRSGHQAEMG